MKISFVNKCILLWNTQKTTDSTAQACDGPLPGDGASTSPGGEMGTLKLREAHGGGSLFEL